MKKVFRKLMKNFQSSDAKNVSADQQPQNSTDDRAASESVVACDQNIDRFDAASNIQSKANSAKDQNAEVEAIEESSEKSPSLPPPLKSPRSWNVLNVTSHSPIILSDNYLDNRQQPNLDDRFRRFRISKDKKPSRKTKSLSLSTSDEFKDYFSNNTTENEPRRSDRVSDQLEKCQIRLQRMSLDAVHNTDAEQQNNEFIKIVADKNADVRGQGNSLENKSYSDLLYGISGESSDDDPQFWKHSDTDGGYFSRHDIVYNKSPKVNSRSSSEEDSDTKEDIFLETISSSMMHQLRRVTKENEDLETETAVLREASEKLKYDLANSKQSESYKDVKFSSVLAELKRLDEKYLMSVENTNRLQLRISNLEQEIHHLRTVCNSADKNNKFLSSQVKELSNQTQKVNQNLLEQNTSDISKLHSEIQFLKTKHEEKMRTIETEVQNKISIQPLIALSAELSRLNNNFNECLTKSEMDKFRDEQQISVGRAAQQILTEVDDKLKNCLVSLKFDLQKELDLNNLKIENTEIECRVPEHENMKQKFLLEISKLTSKLKNKEIEVLKLKEQLDQSKKSLLRQKDEKRKKLIEKSFEKIDFSRKFNKI